jgi:hypothetical protein
MQVRFALGLVLMTTISTSLPSSANQEPTFQQKLDSINPRIEVPLTIGECARVGCLHQTDNSCPAIVTIVNDVKETVRWACNCYGETACIDKAQ